MRSAGSGLPGVDERLDQRAHQPGLSSPDVAERAGHHDGDGEPDARLLAGLAAHEVPLEAEVLVDPACSFARERRGGGIPGTTTGCRAGSAEDPHDSPVPPSRASGAAAAVRATGADLAPGRRRTTALERVAIRFEPLEGHAPLGPGLGADAAHLALLRVHDAVRPPGIHTAATAERKVRDPELIDF